MRPVLLLLGGCTFLAEVHDDIESTLDGRVVVGTALHLVDADGLPTLEDLPAPGDSILSIAVIDASEQALTRASRVVARDGGQEVDLVEDTDNQVWFTDELEWDPGGGWQVEVFTPGREDGATIDIALEVVADVQLPSRWPAGEDGTPETEGRWVLDRRDGPWVIWHPTGQVESRGAYALGKRTGPWVFGRPDGTLAREGSYRAGEPDGVWIRYLPDGTPEVEITYQRGRMVRMRQL